MSLPPQPPASPAEPERPGTLDRLVGEAMTKSGVLWIEIPGDRAWPAWFAWSVGTAYVVNGPGEQHLPWLPADVVLVLRSQDSGGRLLRVAARTRVITPEQKEWGPAVEALAASRLNATDDARARWAASCAVTGITPHGLLVEGPGTYLSESGAAPPPPSRATTLRWRPKHWRGRPRTRRGTS